MSLAFNTLCLFVSSSLSKLVLIVPLLPFTALAGLNLTSTFSDIAKELSASSYSLIEQLEAFETLCHNLVMWQHKHW